MPLAICAACDTAYLTEGRHCSCPICGGEMRPTTAAEVVSRLKANSARREPPVYCYTRWSTENRALDACARSEEICARSREVRQAAGKARRRGPGDHRFPAM